MNGHEPDDSHGRRPFRLLVAVLLVTTATSAIHTFAYRHVPFRWLATTLEGILAVELALLVVAALLLLVAVLRDE